MAAQTKASRCSAIHIELLGSSEPGGQAVGGDEHPCGHDRAIDVENDGLVRSSMRAHGGAESKVGPELARAFGHRLNERGAPHCQTGSR
jgi:hypothetical protein